MCNISADTVLAVKAKANQGEQGSERRGQETVTTITNYKLNISKHH
jgi:hypothetical protein